MLTTISRCTIVLLFAVIPVVVVACDDEGLATVPASTDAGAADATAAPNDAASNTNDAVSGVVTDAADAGACHDLVNIGQIVHSTFLPGPFPTNVGAGGDLTNGRYVLTSVGYYPESLVAAEVDGGFDASRAADADAANVSGGIDAPRYWYGTIEVEVTLGTTIRRTWKTGALPTLPNGPEHRESMSFEPVDSNTLTVHSLCSDFPIDFGVAEYTSTGTELRLWLGEPAYRVDSYTRVN